jgi:thiamine kinase-like enzyme
MAMLGHLRFSESFSKRLVTLLENEIDDFRISSLFFEEFYQRHVQELTLYLRVFDEQDIVEFDSIDDLRTFDADFFSCVDSEIVTNICHSLACSPNAIKDIAVIHAGLTNVSFMFRVAHNMFVYRHPGGTSGNLINRKNERIAQSIAKELGIDNSLVNISSEGWKISRYVQNLVSCDFRKNDWQLRKGMDYLRKIHSLTAQDVDGMKVFDNYEEGVRLMRIASATKGNLLSEFADEIEKTQRLSNFLKSDAERLGYKRVCCHNDVYAPNFLATANRELYLIDWEFAGLNYAANDLACIFSRYEYSEEDIERFLEVYLQHAPTKDEHRFYTSFIPLKAFYWLGWGVYKGSMGEDDGFFFLPAYRIFHRFIDDALASYEK